MAFGKGKESTGSTGSTFVKHIGIGTFEIAAINPNAKELTELFGRPVEQEPVYVTDKGDYKTARVCVYLRNVTGGATSNFVTQVNFFLDGQVKKSQSGKIKVIDKYGNCRWVTEEEYKDHKIPLDKNGNKLVLAPDYRACLGDEDLLVKLLRAYLVLDRPDEYINGCWVFKSQDKLKDIESSLEKTKDYFKGDFSELKEIVKLQPNNKFQALLGIRKTDDGKEYQDVFRHHFMQYWESNLSQLEYQLGQNKEYSYSHTIFEICPLKEYLQDVTPTDLSQGTTTSTADIQTAVQEDDGDLPF